MALSIAVGHGTDALFGIVSGATHTVDGADRVKMFAGTIGTDQPLSPDNKLHVCPMVTVGYASDEGGTTDRTSACRHFRRRRYRDVGGEHASVEGHADDRHRPSV